MKSARDLGNAACNSVGRRLDGGVGKVGVARRRLHNAEDLSPVPTSD